MTLPAFSVITVNLNHAEGLKKTLLSVFAQRGTVRVEQVVIDGGSMDGSLEVIKEFADKIAYQVSEPDQGIYQAMNKGIAAAKGQYLLFLNSGDTLNDETVFADLAAMIVGESELVYGNSKEWIDEGSQSRWQERVAPAVLTPLVFFRSGICHQSVLFHRNLLDQLGGYNEQFQIAGDWELEARALLADCRTQYIDRCIACYEGAGISRQQREQAELEKQQILDAWIPSVIQADYRRHLELMEENRHLNEVETWRKRIRKQSWFINLAMITKWVFTRDKKN